MVVNFVDFGGMIVDCLNFVLIIQGGKVWWIYSHRNSYSYTHFFRKEEFCWNIIKKKGWHQISRCSVHCTFLERCNLVAWKYNTAVHWKTSTFNQEISDWLLINATFCIISAISWHELISEKLRHIFWNCFGCFFFFFRR